MAELRTRQPTGAVPFPFVLLEGEEKAGKSWQLRKLSASPRVGRTFIFDLGEVPSDEYAALGRYEIVEHNGTYHDVWGQVQAAMAEPSDPARPNVIGLDSGTALWEGLSAWVNRRARESKKGREVLAADPDAEVDTPMNLWNDAKDRWWQVFNALRAWPGIVVMTGRAGEVAKVVRGVPVPGQTEYRVQVEKGTPFAVTAQVRCKRSPRTVQLVAAASLGVDMADGRPVDLPMENALEHLVFEVLGAGANFAPIKVVGEAGFTAAEAKHSLLATAARTESNHGRAMELAAKAWVHVGLEGRKDGITEHELAAATGALLRLLRGDDLETDDTGDDDQAARYAAEAEQAAAAAFADVDLTDTDPQPEGDVEAERLVLRDAGPVHR